MLTFKQFLASPVLLEKSNATTAAGLASIVADQLMPKIPDFKEIGARGAKSKKTGVYQIRIAPKNPYDEIDTDALFKRVKAALSKISIIEKKDINDKMDRAATSGKYYSAGFKIGTQRFEIVFAKGANEGEKFENDIIDKLISMHSSDGIDGTRDAEILIKRLNEVNKRINLDNILAVKRRSGATNRASVKSAEEAGSIIADTILEMKDGKGPIYLSLKNDDGDTIANFGISGAFNKDFSVNKKSPYWKLLVSPLPLDFEKIAKGLKAYVPQDKRHTGSNKINTIKYDVVPTSPKLSERFKNVLMLMLGADYIYVKKKGNDFHCVDMVESSIKSEILNKLKVVKIRYPHAARKQVSIVMAGPDSGKYILELRNTRSGIIPTQLNLKYTK